MYRTFDTQRASPVEERATQEALRLWNVHSNICSPATVVSGLVLHALFAGDGQDSRAVPFLLRSIDLAVNGLGLFSKQKARSVYSMSSEGRGRAFLAWGLFTHQA